MRHSYILTAIHKASYLLAGKSLSVFTPLLLASSLALTGCGGSSDSDGGASEFDITTAGEVSGSAVDGPVKGAAVTVYVLDTSQPNLKGRAVAEGETDDLGRMTGLSLSESDMAEAKFIIESVGGIDITTDAPPIISTLRTYTTARNINLIPVDIYATPLSTFTLKVAQEILAANPLEFSWETALYEAQQYVRNVYGLGLLGEDTTGFDLFTTSPVASGSTPVNDSLNYRTAHEVFTAIIDQIHSDNRLAATLPTSNAVLEALASDLSDGVIDGMMRGQELAVLSPVTEDIQALATIPPAFIAGTSIPLSETITLFQNEASTIAPEVTIPSDLSQPAIGTIIAGVDADGNGEIDVLESCLGKYTLSGSGTLIGVTDSIANSTSTATGSAVITAEGNVNFMQELLNESDAATGTIISTADFSLATGKGSATILGCTGSALICTGINSAVGTPAATAPFDESLTITNNTLIDDDGNLIEDGIGLVSWTSNIEQTIDVLGTLIDAVSNTRYVLTAVCEAADAIDTDGDGVVDALDAFQDDPAASVDTDGDGYPDNWNTGKSVNDSTTGLYIDKFPLDAAASLDTDDDGFPDDWNDGKTEADSTTGLVKDDLPNNPNENTDTDGDLVGNGTDAFANDPAASVDIDEDGYPEEWNTGKDAFDSTSIPPLILDECSAAGYQDNDGDGVCEELGLVIRDMCVGTDLGYLDFDLDGICEDAAATAKFDECVGTDLGWFNDDDDARCDDLSDGVTITNPDYDPADPLIWTFCQANPADLSCTNSDNDSYFDDADRCPLEDSELNINTDRDYLANPAKGWVAGDESCDEYELANGDNDSDADGIPDNQDAGSFHPGLTDDFDPLVRNEYIFGYTMTAVGTGVGLTPDDGDTTDLDSDPDPFAILNSSSTSRLQKSDEPAVAGIGAEVPAIYNLYTQTLVWSEFNQNGPTAVFNFWIDAAIDAADIDNLTGTSTATNCQFIATINACATSGFDATESDASAGSMDPTAWLNPSVTPDPGPVPQVGGTITSNFNDLSSITYTTELTATEVLGPGTAAYIEITTVYIFTCSSTNCPAPPM